MSGRFLLVCGLLVALMGSTTRCITLTKLGVASPFEEPVNPFYVQLWSIGLAAEVLMGPVFIADLGITGSLLLTEDDGDELESTPGAPNRESPDQHDPDFGSFGTDPKALRATRCLGRT